MSPKAYMPATVAGLLLVVPFLLGRAPHSDARLSANLHATERWRLDGEAELLGQITCVFADSEGRICLLDSQLDRLLVYDHDGHLVRTVGRSGEGPGEFDFASWAFPRGEGYAVVETLPAEVLVFDPAGALLPSVRPSSMPSSDTSVAERILSASTRGWSVGSNIALVLLSHIDDHGGTAQSTRLALLDETGLEVSRLLDLRRRVASSGPGAVVWHERDDLNRRCVSSGEILWVVPSYSEFRIDGYDADGRLLRSIRRDADPLKRTGEERREAAALYGLDASGADLSIELEAMHPAIAQLSIGPGNRLWALTGSGAARPPEGAHGLYEVFTTFGDPLGQVTLTGLDYDPAADELWIVGDHAVVVHGARDLLKRSYGRTEAVAGEAMVACYCLQDPFADLP